MTDQPSGEPREEEALLQSLGYRQELERGMSGFSNFALSLSIICILAGGITSFHIGLCSAGGASIGLGWPLVCLFSLCVALTMAQVASAFPTAGGLYHWGTILGGRTCGWVTAWLNLVGLITVMAAINSGVFDFALAAFGDGSSAAPSQSLRRFVIVAMTLAQALLNHYGIRWTTRLVDASGWLILITTALLTGALFYGATHLEWSRLWTFTNFSGLPELEPVFPKQNNVPWLFALGFLFPAYTITGFDASAHTAEETLGASTNVPKGIVRSVVVSSLFGWVLVVAILLAIPDLRAGAMKGPNVTPWVIRSALPAGLANVLLGAILLAQFLCGLAALTSASRMTYAFARDGGLPFSTRLSQVHPITRSPSVAVWFTALSGVLFTLFVSYTTIAAVCTLFLYLSYVIPVAAGFRAYGRTWTRMGPWHLGAWYRPLALAASVGCVVLILLGLQPPNEGALKIVAGVIPFLLVVWFGGERRRFRGPPDALRTR